MLENRIHQWLLHGERGISSEAMAAVALGESPSTRWGSWNNPHDPADFNRCRKLLQDAPEVRESFPKIAALSPQWSALIDRWDEINALLESELVDPGNGRADETYKLMRSILDPIDGRIQEPTDA